MPKIPKLNTNELYAQLGSISKSTDGHMRALRGLSVEISENQELSNLLLAFDTAFEEVETKLYSAITHLTKHLRKSNKEKADRLNQIGKSLEESINWYKFFVRNITVEPDYAVLLNDMVSVSNRLAVIRREALEEVVKIEKQYNDDKKRKISKKAKVTNDKKPNVFIVDPPYNTKELQTIIPPSKLVLPENRKKE